MSTSNTQALKLLEELIDAKSQLADKLKDLKVTVTTKDYPDIVSAVSGLFGSEYVNDGVAVITFDMVVKCLEVVRNAGIGKAQELIK